MKGSLAATLFVVAAFCVSTVGAESWLRSWVCTSTNTTGVSSTPCNGTENDQLLRNISKHVELLPSMNERLRNIETHVVNFTDLTNKLMEHVAPGGEFSEEKFAETFGPIFHSLMRFHEKRSGNVKWPVLGGPKFITITLIVLYAAFQLYLFRTSLRFTLATAAPRVGNILALYAVSEITFFVTSVFISVSIAVLDAAGWFFGEALGSTFKGWAMVLTEYMPLFCSLSVVGWVVVLVIARETCWFIIVRLFGDIIPATATAASAEPKKPITVLQEQDGVETIKRSSSPFSSLWRCSRSLTQEPSAALSEKHDITGGLSQYDDVVLGDAEQEIIKKIAAMKARGGSPKDD